MPEDDDWSGRRLHFVGIGGAGMSGLALVAQALGAQVSGSDRGESSYTERLREHGIAPTIGHAKENVPDDAEVVYSTAVGPENPERQAAGGNELHRADLLAQIAALKRCIAITGTHGKTTTSGMVVHVLRACGLDPAYVVGGELRDTDSNAGWGSGEWIVIEADESDRSLLKFSPEIAVLTNAELDHHSTYASRLDLEATFTRFMAKAAHPVVWNRPRLLALCPPNTMPYDAPDPILEPDGARFRWDGHAVTLSVPGEHNAVNAAGALTAARLAGADPDEAARSITRSAAPAGALSCSARRRTTSPCTTTTPIIRPRSRRPSRRRGRCDRSASSASSSRTCTRGPRRSRGSSARRSPRPTSPSRSTCTPRGSGPRIFPASTAA